MNLIRYVYCLFLFVQTIHPESAYARNILDAQDSKKHDVVVEIKLQNHLFSPAEIYVPAHKKVTLVIHNLDPTVEEFDSPPLKREKLLKSNSITHIILAPLMPGRYDFIGEFYQDTAKGAVIVEE